MIGTHQTQERAGGGAKPIMKKQQSAAGENQNGLDTQSKRSIAFDIDDAAVFNMDEVNAHRHDGFDSGLSLRSIENYQTTSIDTTGDGRDEHGDAQQGEEEVINQY